MRTVAVHCVWATWIGLDTISLISPVVSLCLIRLSILLELVRLDSSSSSSRMTGGTESPPSSSPSSQSLPIIELENGEPSRPDVPTGRSVLFAPSPVPHDATPIELPSPLNEDISIKHSRSQSVSKASTPYNGLSPTTELSQYALEGSEISKPEKVHHVISGTSSRRNSAATTLVEHNLSNQLRSALGYPPKKQGITSLTPVRTPMGDELEEGTDPLTWSDKYKA